MDEYNKIRDLYDKIKNNKKLVTLMISMYIDKYKKEFKKKYRGYKKFYIFELSINIRNNISELILFFEVNNLEIKNNHFKIIINIKKSFDKFICKERIILKENLARLCDINKYESLKKEFIYITDINEYNKILYYDLKIFREIIKYYTILDNLTLDSKKKLEYKDKISRIKNLSFIYFKLLNLN